MALAERVFACFNAGEMDAFWELVHPDVVMATDRSWPGGGEYRGAAAFRRFMQQFLEAFQDVRFEQEEPPRDFGRRALLRGRWVGSGAASHIEAASPSFSVVLEARDGLVSGAWFFFDAARAEERARG